MTPLPIRIGIYARYSSDIQSPTSIEDQVAACRDFIDRSYKSVPVEVTTFKDAALSGTTLNRPGLQRLIRFVQGQQIDVVITEGLDRLSRSIGDIDMLFTLLTNAGIRLLTLHEGEVSDLHVWIKGGMSKMYLKDLHARIRRGQAGRTLDGYVMGQAPYGYRSIRGVIDTQSGRPIAGLKEIAPDEAAIILKIFEEYVAGKKIREITRELNEAGVPCRRARQWRDKTISSFLLNPFYKGEVIYQRTTAVRDPLTGKVKRKQLPRSDWVISKREDLRIVSDKLWLAAEARRKRLAPKRSIKPKKEFASHQRVLTDYVFCGACGRVKHIANRGRYVCTGNRYEKTCGNARGTGEPEARETLFKALLKAVKRLPPLRPTILKAYEEDIRRRHDLDRREAEVQEKIDRLMQAIEDGIDYAQSVERVKALQFEKARLKEAKTFEAIPTIGTEEEITAKITRTLDLLRTETDREPVREMLAAIKPRIVMTPIQGQYRGETIAVELPKDPEPWARLWISLQQS